MNLDPFIVPLDRALRTLFAPAQSARPVPGTELDQPPLGGNERHLSGALMRINHTGEVCAQALYEGQLLTAREARVQELLLACRARRNRALGLDATPPRAS